LGEDANSFLMRGKSFECQSKRGRSVHGPVQRSAASTNATLTIAHAHFRARDEQRPCRRRCPKDRAEPTQS
jgi:hypothetical protein